MPIIKVTQADVLRNKVVDAAWYGANISKIDGPSLSAKGDSYNFVVSFTLDGKSPAPGKEIQQYFNTKAIGRIVPLLSAVRGKEVEAPGAGQELAIDTDELMNKNIDVKVSVDTYEGQLRNGIEAFLPYGNGANVAVAF